ncbi:MAG: hypothetical protein RQ966_17865 [Acetobacteraceae bacterium]|nr:hypothetical protein [Acetobacteraceae bacterium]
MKWFCAFDVAGQPQSLENVLCPDFEQLTGIALAVLLAGCFLERSILGHALTRALDRVTSVIQSNTEILLRATCGFFFVAIWTLGDIIMTPELKTSAPYVPWLQLVVAAGLIWRRTLAVSALGIVALYGIAIQRYGIFHLMDYPIFLGIAAFFALTSFQRKLFGTRPLDVVRWAAAITLMWASIEKWAYPEWTFPLFATHPSMSMNFDIAFFMRAAGVVEFTLAFALLWSPLVRRSAAIILAGIFFSAIPEFGKLDAIGHSAIIAVLIVIAADNAPAGARSRLFQPMLAPMGYAVSLVAFLTLYYVAHMALFNTDVF